MAGLGRASKKYFVFPLLLASVLLLTISGCGKKGPPQPLNRVSGLHGIKY